MWNPKQHILSVAQSRLSATSSAAVCRRLSSVGRRVLSIESVCTFQGAFFFFRLLSLRVFFVFFSNHTGANVLACLVDPQTDRKAPGKRGGSIPNLDVPSADWAQKTIAKTCIWTVLSLATVCPGSRYPSRIPSNSLWLKQKDRA